MQHITCDVTLVTIEPFHRAAVHGVEDLTIAGDREAIEELVATARKRFVQVVAASPHLSDDVPGFVENITEPGRWADVVASGLRTIGSEEQQGILGTLNVRERLARLNQLLAKEIEILDIRSTIQSQVQSELGKNQREYLLREQMAVRKLKTDHKGPILCFVGPPGVGKTSLARGIAESLDREVVRVSLGGMRDEAEIRGHRRTYIGALPGQVIRGLRRAETRNPLFILDEIDKLGTDFRGDPASALLEVLDPEQNNTFRDHYLDVPFDLSEVLFITTANFLDPVPPPLLDRMEVLELPGYTEDEKLAIATEHLVSRQVDRHGLSATQITFTDRAITTLIRNYTREAGVRNLERELGALCRKVARWRAEGNEAAVLVTPELLAELLGPAKFQDEEVAERTKRPGVATGLAWTPAGGHVLFVEAARMKNGSGLELTA